MLLRTLNVTPEWEQTLHTDNRNVARDGWACHNDCCIIVPLCQPDVFYTGAQKIDTLNDRQQSKQFNKETKLNVRRAIYYPISTGIGVFWYLAARSIIIKHFANFIEYTRLRVHEK